MISFVRMCRLESRKILAQINTQSIRNHQTKSTMDQNEVDFHSNLAQGWWNLNGPVAPLHSLNDIRVPFIRDGLISTNRVKKENVKSPKPLEGVKILEVGCGAGILTEALARIHANVTALEPSETLIKTAREHLFTHPPGRNLSERIDYRVETIEDHLKQNTIKYDAVVVSEVLEHVDDKSGFLKACTEPLAAGGSIFITTFNKTNLAWFGGIVMAENVLKKIPEGTHDWNKFISPRDTRRLLEHCGCTTVLCNGFVFEFWKNQWVWTNHHQFSYALQAIMPTKRS